jgi:hypothetical protein
VLVVLVVMPMMQGVTVGAQGGGSAKRRQPVGGVAPRVATLGLVILGLLASHSLGENVVIEVDVAVAHPVTPVHTVADYYVSFALDNAFIRDPAVLPPDATNSTRIDFSNPQLQSLMALVSGGLLRVGGTYVYGAPGRQPPGPTVSSFHTLASPPTAFSQRPVRDPPSLSSALAVWQSLRLRGSLQTSPSTLKLSLSHALSFSHTQLHHPLSVCLSLSSLPSIALKVH